MEYLRRIRLHHLLYAVGLLGIVFYALSPLLFPDVPGLRQPELLPVYCAFVGLGQVIKGNIQISTNTGGQKLNDKDTGAESETKVSLSEPEN